MKLSLLIQAIDRASAPLKKVTGAARDLAGKGLAAVTRAAGATDRALGKVANSSRFNNLRANVRKFAKFDLQLAQLGAIILGKKLGLAVRNATLLGTRIVALGAATAAYAAGRFGIGIFSASSDFEQIQDDLERITGSAMKAAVGIDAIKTMARNSVIPIDDLAAAYVRAAKAKISTGGSTFKTLMDEAVAAKKPLLDIVEIVAGAKLGDFGGLNSLDITTSKAKGRVLFTFLDKMGKRTVRNVGDNAREVEAAITKIFALRSAGAAERKLTSFSGLWQALKNNFVSFQDDIGRAGVFDWVKTQLSDVMKWVGQAAKDGRLKKWATEISAKMIALGEALKGVNWTQFATDVVSVVSSISKLVGWAGRLNNKLDELASIPTRYGVGAMINGTGAYAPTSAPPKARPFAPGLGPLKPGAKPMALPPGAFGGGKAQVGGKISLEIRTAQPGTTAVVKSASATNRNVPIEVNTGRVRTAA